MKFKFRIPTPSDSRKGLAKMLKGKRYERQPNNKNGHFRKEQWDNQSYETEWCGNKNIWGGIGRHFAVLIGTGKYIHTYTVAKFF